MKDSVMWYVMRREIDNLKRLRETLQERLSVRKFWHEPFLYENWECEERGIKFKIKFHFLQRSEM